MDQAQGVYQFIELTGAQTHCLKQLAMSSQADSLQLFQDLQLNAQGKKINIDNLRIALQELPDDMRIEFQSKTIQLMAQNSLQILQLRPYIPLFMKPLTQSFKADLVYQLVSLSFMCLLIKQYPDQLFPLPFNMQYLISGDGDKFQNRIEKIKCYIHYFIQASKLPLNDREIILEKMAFNKEYHMNQFFKGNNDHSLTYNVWKQSDCQLGNIEFSQNVIEQQQKCIVVDFANKYLGGGVLGGGCVQEEIMFTIRPETLVSVFLSTKLRNDEAFIIKNTWTFSDYSGYAKSFKFISRIPKDMNQTILAIDALHYLKNDGVQFSNPEILRELNKAFIGFCNSRNATKEEYNQMVSTGKWGCGAFNGDVELKLVIQWIAYSQSRNKGLVLNDGKLLFSTYQDAGIQKTFIKLIPMLKTKYITVGRLSTALFQLQGRPQSLFQQLLK